MYNSDQMSILISNQSVKFLIIGINFVLRLLIIKLITYIGVDTESEQTRLITNGVFVVQFFNTALLLLVVNANLVEQGFPLSMLSSSRGLSDFSHLWFSDIGVTLTGAMLFNVYWPIVEFFTFGAMRQGFRLMDRGFTCNKKQTKKTTIQQYVELYSGPIFFIHYKYSAILNIVFVTMMYGMGLPVLFPIASASLFVLYFVEKCMLYYVYREPPMYDEKLNSNALGILTWAPLLFLSFGYWMLSSKQLLGNSLPHIYTYLNDQNIMSGHKWTEVFAQAAYGTSKPSMPLLYLFWGLLVLTIFKSLLIKVWNFFPFLAVGDFEIDENLDNYFMTLDTNDRNWSQEEERYYRKNLGLRILSEYEKHKLQEVKEGENVMKGGAHCYDILASEQYAKDFQYFSPALGEERKEYIKDADEDEDNDMMQSDLVKIVLNLAYLPPSLARTFTFDKSFYKQAKSHSHNDKEKQATGYTGPSINNH